MKFLKQSDSGAANLVLTPLVDVIFLLILFFLVSSTFETGEKELDLRLPQTKGKSPKKQTNLKWYINIRDNGKIIVSGKEMTLSALEVFLKSNLDKREKAQLIVRADGEVAYKIVAKIMGLFNEFGFSRVALQTVHENKTAIPK